MTEQQSYRRSTRRAPDASPRRVRPQQQQQGAHRPLPTVVTSRAIVPVKSTPATTTQKIKYSAISGIGSGVLLGALGMHSAGAVLALGVGVAAWTFSDEIRAKLETRAAKKASIESPNNRPDWLTWKWWNTPRPLAPQQQGNPVHHSTPHSYNESSPTRTTVYEEEPEEDTQPAQEAAHAGNTPTNQKGQAGPWIPPQYSLDNTLGIVQTFNSRGYVYFGNSENGGVAIPLREMYHVMDVSSSGKGKSNRFRLAMMQMVGSCETYCINPLAANVKPVDDEREIEVWKPIYDRLANKRPIKDGNEIKDLLTKLVTEIATRNSLEEEGDFTWKAKPIFAFIDELPEVFAQCPEASKLLDKIGRMGRQYGIFLWVAGQTAKVDDIGLSTAAQAQFKTRIYGGGDKTSAERLMKGIVPTNTERILQSNGAGLTLMLAEGMDGCSFTRSPLVSNEALFEYLGLPPFRKEEWMRKKTASAATQGSERAVASIPATNQGSNSQLPAHDIETITTWYTTGKIDQDLFFTLIKTVAQPETKKSTNGNAHETALESRAVTQEKDAFPVSTKAPASVSTSGNSGNTEESTAETALQANSGQLITGVFPTSTAKAETPISSSELEKLGVSPETIKHVKKMKEANFSDRDISEIVELRGRRYETYKKILAHLGYRERA